MNTLFERRVFALKESIKRAQNPEWKDLWRTKLDELIVNEQKNRGEIS
jgi:hypothetical protein